MVKKSLYRMKHFIDRSLFKLKKLDIPKNSYIRRPYDITGGSYIHIGKNVSIQSYSNLACFDRYADVDYYPVVEIGDNVFINRFFTLLSAGSLTIGHDTFIGSYVSITNENHGIIPNEKKYGVQPLCVKSVSVGNNCWIGDHAIILPGVTIGDYSIIGAGSVVTKSIPEYCIAVGNPARVVKVWNKKDKEWERP